MIIFREIFSLPFIGSMYIRNVKQPFLVEVLEYCRGNVAPVQLPPRKIAKLETIWTPQLQIDTNGPQLFLYWESAEPTLVLLVCVD
jgi:hypothetical protein